MSFLRNVWYAPAWGRRVKNRVLDRLIAAGHSVGSSDD